MTVILRGFVSIANIRKKKQYYTLNLIQEANLPSKYFGKEFKFRFLKLLLLALLMKIDLKGFEIVNRPSGFVYKDKKGINRIKNRRDLDYHQISYIKAKCNFLSK